MRHVTIYEGDMSKIVQVLSGLALVAIFVLLVGAIDAAFAQATSAVPLPVPTRAAPGPIAGAGLPIIAVAAAAYWLVRRFRQKSQ